MDSSSSPRDDTTSGNDMGGRTTSSISESIPSTSVQPMQVVAESSVKVHCKWKDCGELMQNRDQLWAHVDKIHINRCLWKTCNESFNSEHEFRSHIWQHTVSVCHLCDTVLPLSMTVIASLKHSPLHGINLDEDQFRNLKLKSLNAQKNTCHWKICGQNITKMCGLWYHLKWTHFDDKKCYWGDCGHYATSKLNMKCHVCWHTTNGNMKCFVCKKVPTCFVTYTFHARFEHFRIYRQYTNFPFFPVRFSKSFNMPLPFDHRDKNLFSSNTRTWTRSRETGSQGDSQIHSSPLKVKKFVTYLSRSPQPSKTRMSANTEETSPRLSKSTSDVEVPSGSSEFRFKSVSPKASKKWSSEVYSRTFSKGYDASASELNKIVKFDQKEETGTCSDEYTTKRQLDHTEVYVTSPYGTTKKIKMDDSENETSSSEEDTIAEV